MDGTLADTNTSSLDTYRAASTCPPGYLNFAAIGPLLAPVLHARHDAERILSTQPERLAELDVAAERGRVTAAGLLGFDTGQVMLSPNTSTGLFQAAFAMPPGEVIVSPFDFPANTAPWRRAAEQGRLSVRWMADPAGPRPQVTPDAIASALTAKTVAVAVSAVDFVTGDCVDLPGIRAAIGDRLLIVDAIQGFGVVDLPWATADVVSSGGQKWLRAGWGTGVLACSPRAVERLGTGLSGWSGVRGADDPSVLAVLPEPRADVGRFEITPPDMIAMAAFAAALDAIATVGMPTVSAEVRRLTERLRAGLSASGATINGQTDRAFYSGITSFTVPGQPPAAVVQALGRAGITVTERQGAVRVSIHASSTADVVDELIAEVSALS